MLAQINLGDLGILRWRCPRFMRLLQKRLCFSFSEALSSQILLCKIFVSDHLVFYEACHQVLGELLLNFFNLELKFYQNVAEFLQKVSFHNYLIAMILLRQLLLLRHTLLIEFLKVRFDALLELIIPYQDQRDNLYEFQLKLQTLHSMIFFPLQILKYLKLGFLKALKYLLQLISTKLPLSLQ